MLTTEHLAIVNININPKPRMASINTLLLLAAKRQGGKMVYLISQKELVAELAAKIAATKNWNELSFQEVNTARGSAGKRGQFAHLVQVGECPSCGREFAYGSCRWTDCPENF